MPKDRKRKNHFPTKNTLRKKRSSARVQNKKDAPLVNSIADLVKISRSIRHFKNIDTEMLWRISPYLEQLNNMIGMEKLKETLFLQIIYYLQGFHERSNEEYLHTILMGKPGCGKTTVAKIIGKLYYSMGILSKKGKFKIAYRDDFVAEYLGQTAIKTRKLLNSCIGGVLLIDEVYSLGPGKSDSDSFSKEALDTLTSFLSEHKRDFCCICAGYESDIKKCFFKVNKGLERRFPWVHYIEEYSPEDLTKIALKMIDEQDWDIDIKEKDLTNIIKENEDLFKNVGGDIENYITKAKMCHSKRVFSLSYKNKFIFTMKDFNNAIELIRKNKKNENKNNDYLNMYS